MSTDIVEIETTETVNAKTPAQAKIDAVANLTMSVYAKASMLELTAEESKKLAADFPDHAFRAGAAGKENLIYIEHAFLRDRLNEVFGPGSWALIPRSRWTEEFKTSKGATAIRIYVEAMLCIRGCFVDEAIGDMDYYPSNASTNYGDAVEGAKTQALRRCAKTLGIGLQAWKKGWCEGWWTRTRGKPEYKDKPETTLASAIPQDALDAIKRAKTAQDCTKLFEWAKKKPWSDETLKEYGKLLDDRVAELSAEGGAKE